MDWSWLRLKVNSVQRLDPDDIGNCKEFSQHWQHCEVTVCSASPLLFYQQNMEHAICLGFISLRHLTKEPFKLQEFEVWCWSLDWEKTFLLINNNNTNRWVKEKTRSKKLEIEDMDPSEVEFLAEKEEVTIVPNFSHDEVFLIAGNVGPFNPSLPMKVPLWMAINLKQRQKCRIQPPDWMQVGE